MKKSNCFFAGFLGLLILVFSLPDFFVPYYNIDELTNALFAKMILAGRLSLADFLGNTYILTHYYYVFVVKLFGANSLTPFYMLNLLWRVLNALVFYFAGKEMTARKEGGWLASFFYITASLCFYSKDYRAVLAENLAILPLLLAALCYFRAVRLNQVTTLFLAGFFAGVAGLFKAPAAIMIFAIGFSLFFKKGGRNKLAEFIWLGSGFIIAIFSPLIFTSSPLAGIDYLTSNVGLTHKVYIGAYENLPLLYWGLKYVMRTLLVAVACPYVWYFGFKSLRTDTPKLRFFILFVFFWFLTNWYVVSIGKRIFFHYFVFLIPPLCLLALPSALRLWDQLKIRGRTVQKKMSLLLLSSFLIFPIGWTLEAWQGWSINRPNFSQLVHHIRQTTHPDQKIYVWGIAPQIYFFSGREPATTFFWADTLAGMSPGSPAMEYMRITGQRLTLPESVRLDLQQDPLEEGRGSDQGRFNLIGEAELLTAGEILEKIENPLWKKTFEDFFKTPPVLFLDTSPSGIRGFGHFPIWKYELLAKFVAENYQLEKTLDGVNIYRLKNPTFNAN